MDDLAWKLLGSALTALGVIVWWVHQRHEKRIDGHDKEFTDVRREVRYEFAGRDTVTRIEKTFEDKIDAMQNDIDKRHTSNEGRFNRIDDKLDTIIEKLLGPQR